MYSGFRALSNRVRGRFRPKPLLAVLDGNQFCVQQSRVVVRVHARGRARCMPSDARVGMFSVYLRDPPFSRWRYKIARMSAHFGCGHIEVAFYETDGEAVVFGVRNILKSNAQRLGRQFAARQWGLTKEADEVRVLHTLKGLSETEGIPMRLAPPEECVQLSVDWRLVHPVRQAIVFESLLKKYRRISKRINVMCGLESTGPVKIQESGLSRVEMT